MCLHNYILEQQYKSCSYTMSPPESFDLILYIHSKELLDRHRPLLRQGLRENLLDLCSSGDIVRHIDDKFANTNKSYYRSNMDKNLSGTMQSGCAPCEKNQNSTIFVHHIEYVECYYSCIWQQVAL